MLTDEQKKELKEWVDKIEIDVETLPLSYYDINVFCVEEHLAVGGWVYDEDEYHEAQIEKAIDYLETDGGVFSYFPWTDDEDVAEQLTKEAVEYIRSL